MGASSTVRSHRIEWFPHAIEYNAPGRTLMHPYLVPGEWLVTARFFDPDGAIVKTWEVQLQRVPGPGEGE